MRFHIRGDHVEVTPALREYVEKKIGKLERYFETPLDTEAHVTLRVKKDRQNVEVTVPLVGLVLRSEEKGTDMYASIDLVVDKLERQIRKYKTKVNRKERREGMGAFPFVRDETSAQTPQSFEDEEQFEVVRTKQFTLKPMDVEEAILQMNMVGHNFFVFANADTSAVNVVYKRADGKYGLIEPAK